MQEGKRIMNISGSGSVRAAENDRKTNRFKAAIGRARSGTWLPPKRQKSSRRPLNGDPDHKNTRCMVERNQPWQNKTITKVVKRIEAVERVQMVDRY